MMKTVVLLGAGFSIPAGFPSAKEFNEKFFNAVEGKLLRFSSSEWAWDEHGDAASNNGRLNLDHLNISYLLSELVERYQAETYEIFDYEPFYDWFRGKWKDIPFMQTCCDSVNDRLKSIVIENSRHFFKKVDINQYITIDKCYNDLVADLLGRKYNLEKMYPYYSDFIDLINIGDVDIFTLNHDLVVEFLLNKNAIPYSDGFSNANSSVIGESGELLPIFDGSYDNQLRLFKLHGSVDYYLFRKMNQTNNYLANTGEYWFYKPGSYGNKHNAKRIDSVSGKIVQDFNPDITSQFLIGKNKLDIINSHMVYKPLFEQFENSLSQVEKLVVIGYSYRDKHVNMILKKSIDKFNFQILNINPSMEFPFRKNYNRNSITQLDDLTKLRNLLVQ